MEARLLVCLVAGFVAFRVFGINIDTYLSHNCINVCVLRAGRNTKKKAASPALFLLHAQKARQTTKIHARARYCSHFHIKVLRLLQCMINQRMTNTKNPGLCVASRVYHEKTIPLVPSQYRRQCPPSIWGYQRDAVFVPLRTVSHSGEIC